MCPGPADDPRTKLVEIENRDAIRILRLNRPPVNALDLTLVQELLGAVKAAASDASCAGLVLTGSPGAFSAGIDNREVPRYEPEKRALMLGAVNRLVLALYGFPKPSAAAISGHALGGAFVLALACDVRVACRGPFQLGLTEAAAGFPFPAGPLEVVRAELTPAQARTLVLGSISAPPESEAFAGLIDRVVEAEELLDVVIEGLRRLSELPAYGRVKQQLRAPTVQRLTEIVENDDEPLLKNWV